jgi:hypothetical protein
MPTDIKLKNSVTATNAPTSLQQGEVAINITDKKVWVGNAATTPVLLLGSGADGTFTNLTVSGVASFADGTVSLPSITNIGDTNTGIFFPAADTIAFTEGGVESMRINSAGRLSIGTTETGAELSVYGSNANPVSSTTFWSPNHEGIILRNTSDVTSTVTGISFQGGSSGAGISGIGNILENVTLGALGFFTGGSGRSNTVPERMRITSAGIVGINTASPASFAGFLVVNGGVSLLNSNRLYLWSPSNGFAPAIYAPSESIAFTDNNGVETLRVGSTGVLTLKGGNNAASGVGITFPATQNASSDANTLDDYEEGTYTPIVASGITSPTYSTQVGRYTKIGRVCYFQVVITVTGGTRNSNIVQVSLPLLSASSLAFAGGGSFNYVNAGVVNSTTTNLPLLYIGSGLGNVDFYATNAGSFIGTDLATATPQFYLSGWYEV